MSRSFDRSHSRKSIAKDSPTPLPQNSPQTNLSATTPINRMQVIQVLVLGGLVASAIVIPLLINALTQSVLAIKADDLSGSGYRPETLKALCQARAGQTRTNDQEIAIAYADRAEVTQDDHTASGLKTHTCNTPPVPPSLGKHTGTDPTTMLGVVVDAIATARAQGNQDPIVVTVWIQDAEPVAGQAMDLARLKQQVNTITSHRGAIAIIGPTGQLQTQLRTVLKENPQVRICPTQSLKDCIDWAYQTGRKIPRATTLRLPPPNSQKL